MSSLRVAGSNLRVDRIGIALVACPQCRAACVAGRHTGAAMAAWDATLAWHPQTRLTKPLPPHNTSIISVLSQLAEPCNFQAGVARDDHSNYKLSFALGKHTLRAKKQRTQGNKGNTYKQEEWPLWLQNLLGAI